MKKPWTKPVLVEFGSIDKLTQQGRVRGTAKCTKIGIGAPVLIAGALKYCGFIDAVNHINQDAGS